MQTTEKKVKIGLMGPFGYGNLGDAAIQDAMIQHIRIYFPNAEIFGFSSNPEDTEKRHGIKSFPISRMSWIEENKGKKNLYYKFAAWLKSQSNPRISGLERWMLRLPKEFGLFKEASQTLKGFDYLIVSGGGQLDDYWGGGGPWSHPYTLLKYGLITKHRKIKYLIVSVGAGPINASLSKTFIKQALSLAKYRSYRDEFSRNLVKTIGFDRGDPIVPDLAHSLQIYAIEAPLGLEKLRPIVAVGPIGYFREGCWPENDNTIYNDYLAKMSTFTKWLLNRNYDVLFIPGEIHYDQIAIGDLFSSLDDHNQTDAAGRLLRPDIQTVTEFLSYLSITDIVVASRFHNILLAHLIGKPVLALSYQEKIDSLMADTSQSQYCFNVGQFEVEHLKKQFISIEENCETIKAQIQEQSSKYKEALAEQYEIIFRHV